ncbi:PREDICTED: luc7-like protein 3 [Polistes canadensis]|uniref:luc7-like protein 3 n=1 Tax=Polistes canadensis TaxID=91411 RepID=UPI000718D57B|nr:PREDICTED: luc7-like protein 3 [Polistes canadensis]
MARYSSDSDSDYSNRYKRKHSRKSRSTSSDTSESSPYRKRSSKHSKSKRRHRSHSRSRGRDRSSKSYKSARSNSGDRDKRRYRSRTRRSHSSDRSKRKMRSNSRDKSRSRSSSSQSTVKPIIDKSNNPITKDDFLIEPRIKESVLEEINSEGFMPKQFTSSSSHTKESKFKNIVIDISADTIQIPTVTDISTIPESIFHPSIMHDQEARFDKWVKKLYTLRQKALVDMTHSNST